eukprot:CAMPEP_0201153036 /NCGR_PEP_ID=MMETSP0851-20130426/13574_1 /ASSEMBLY_ACC=CAM_ASM_000631 /TAXON_ID=183588 /ORGANISM="Pseudo-nitzschia fraudulenta, Strain WWA7" /LENGTH=353 /DNA_ID=CAMNT_0047430171 /DNA_START=131 /DNA_END=1192 /DNA_ORIENTATION=-
MSRRGSSSSIVSSATTTTTTTTAPPAPAPARTTTVALGSHCNNNYNNNTPSRRSFGSGGGTRGARGHGWWVNYRAGKGGRHLQGTYSHLDVEAMEEWNDAIYSLGSTMAYLDVRVEALGGGGGGADEGNNNNNETIHRLKLELATEAMPLATNNLLKLLESSNSNNEEAAIGYESSTLHRIEKGVGILGGLIEDNPNLSQAAVSNLSSLPTAKQKIGACHPDLRSATSATTMDVSSEHLVLNHLPGTITMLQPRIGAIDSRFLLLSHHAPHMDGVSIAVGRLAGEDSLERLKAWESTLITSHGIPTNVALRIVACGVLDEDDSDSETMRSSNSTDGGIASSTSEAKVSAMEQV